MPTELLIGIAAICIFIFFIVWRSSRRLDRRRSSSPRGTPTTIARSGSRRRRDDDDAFGVFDDVSLADRGPGRARPIDPGVDDVAPARLRVIGGGNSSDSGDSGDGGGD